MLQYLDGFLNFLIPDRTIRRAEDLENWKLRRRAILSRNVRRNFVFFAIFLIIHPFLVEIPNQANHLGYFIVARWGLAMLLLGVSTLERFDLIRFKGQNLFFFMVLIIPSVIQGLCSSWDPRVPIIFSVIVPLMSASSVFTNAGTKVLHYICGVVIQIPFILNDSNKNDIPTLMSMGLLGFALIAFLGLIYLGEVEKFKGEQRYVRQVKKTQKVQADFFKALRGFISGSIFERIEKNYAENGGDIQGALLNVLALRKTEIAVVHSDIRKYTQSAKDIDTYVIKQAIPNIQAIAELAENNDAVTRLVGDLVLSYFEPREGEARNYSILRAVKFGLEILNRTQYRSDLGSDEPEVKRYVLISYGLGVTGNIGAFEGAREITCMGSPVNILSRVDRLTKKPQFARELEREPVLVLTQKALLELNSLVNVIPGLKVFDLSSQQLRIEDFPEERSLHLVPSSEELYQKVTQSLR